MKFYYEEKYDLAPQHMILIEEEASFVARQILSLSNV